MAQIKLINSSIVEGDFTTLDPLHKLVGSYHYDNDGIVSSDFQNQEEWHLGIGETTVDNNSSLFGTKIQKIRMKYIGNDSEMRQMSEESLKEWFQTNLNFTSIYEKLKISLPVPTVDLDNSKFSIDNIDVESFYNYEFYNYELASMQIPSNALPSYLLFDYSEYVQSFDSDLSNEIRSYSNRIDPGHGKVAYSAPLNDSGVTNKYEFNVSVYDEEKLPIEVKNKHNNYFRIFTDFVRENAISFSDVATKNSNIFALCDYNSNRLDYLPFYNRIRIPAMKDESAAFLDLLYGDRGYDSTNIDKTLIDLGLNRFLFSFMKNSTPTEEEFRYQTISETWEKKKLKTWNLSDWWTSEFFDSHVEGDDETFLLSKEDLTFSRSTAGSVEKRLRKVIALGMIRQDVINSLKTFSQSIILNHNCAKSIIGYKVEKYLTAPNVEGRSPVQTLYFESDGSSPLEFIDTQVSYDTKYYYSINAIVAVVGSSYSYRNLETKVQFEGILGENNEIWNRVGIFDFITAPMLKVIQLPLVNDIETRIIEPPPLRPSVVVTNEKYTKNKVKFFLQDRMGNVVDENSIEKYIPITFNDNLYKNKLLDSYSREDDKIFYSSKAATGIFEVFRLDKKPSNYSDFSTGYLGSTQNSNDLLIDFAYSSEFCDYIEHGKKYYYLFRAVTPHLNASNPSYVFEVELIQDADEVAIEVDAYHIEEEKEETDPTITMRRFLQLIPNPQHTALDPNSNLEQDGHPTTTEAAKLTLGLDGLEKSLWEFNDHTKKFIKLRLTSKTSGKKIDLNLTFKVKSESDQN